MKREKYLDSSASRIIRSKKLFYLKSIFKNPDCIFVVRIFFMNDNSKISAVIITFNEQEHIGACIRSLQGVVDEVLVVDSHSTDDTVSISEALGAKVISVKWQGYAETKNVGNQNAINNIILSIDADEELSEELCGSILAQKALGFRIEYVYKFNRLNNYCGQWIKYAGWYPDTKVRIFHKLNAKWEGEVHEELVYTNTVTQKHLTGDLLHYSIKDKEDHIARIHKYNKLARKYPTRMIGYLSAISTFVKLYIIKLGFLDGKLGYQLCLISAKAKVWR